MAYGVGLWAVGGVVGPIGVVACGGEAACEEDGGRAGDPDGGEAGLDGASPAPVAVPGDEAAAGEPGGGVEVGPALADHVNCGGCGY